MTFCRSFFLLTCALLLPGAAASPIGQAPPAEVALCDALHSAAARNGLPEPFFTRLIWQESRFDPSARSPAGAEGIAQFMPGTAAERGLNDPFAPARALDESAAYLKELRQSFGNLGLAAAAYNAGPTRLRRWMAGGGPLPDETIAYVDIVTGRSIADWLAASKEAGKPIELRSEPNFSCTAFAGDAARRRLPALVTDTDLSGGAPRRWAVILVASFNKAAVLAEWQLMRARFAEALANATPSLRRRHLGGMPAKKYVLQIESDDAQTSSQLCRRIERARGNCILLRNSLR